MASFSLNSTKSLISFFISSFTKESLSRVLFSFHVNVGFLLFMLLVKTSLSPWRSDRMHGIISILFFLMIRRPPRSTHAWSSAASDVYKRQAPHGTFSKIDHIIGHKTGLNRYKNFEIVPCIQTDHHRLRLIFNKNTNNTKPIFNSRL